MPPSTDDASPPDARPAAPVLPDPWDVQRGVRLDGPMERTSFSVSTMSLVTGLFALGCAFLLFQVLITPVVLFAQIGLENLQSLGADPSQLLATYTRELILSNSTGQIFGLAIPALLFARLHASRIAGFMRLRGVDGGSLVLSVLGLFALQPLVQWLAELNQKLPVPESLQALDQSQMQLIMEVLGSDFGMVFVVSMLAVVPGICEELLFRGYAQRQFERAVGVSGGILLSGTLFGLYHLRLTQVLPLSVLGIYLAYLTWRTGSLVPAIVVHFLNNAVSVGVGRYLEASPDYSVALLEDLSVPAYAVVFAFVFFASVAYVLHRRGRDLKAERDASPPSEEGGPSSHPS
jgi:membrane protease YdiL (CAAX protease family)